MPLSPESGAAASAAERRTEHPRQFRLRLARGGELALGERTLIMGVLNVTPDSFSDGGRFLDPISAAAHAERMVGEGADIIDVGGESTRPCAEAVPAEEQIRRVVPVITAIRKRTDVPVSIDTSDAAVAARAFDEGADILNDVTACRGDESIAALAAERGAPVILMHMQGTPRTMQDAPRYGDVVQDVARFLAARIEAVARAGVARDQTLVDPGLGFGKTLAHNLELLNRLVELSALGRPLVVGPSRKSMIGMVLGVPVEGRLMGDAAAVAASVARGAHIVRVHDVAQMREVARMTEAIERGGG